jgi:predicted O-linked N-acetylglucosamine transferase (SPINDLY family)
LPSADPATVFAEHRAWSARHAEGLTAAAAPHPNDRSLERRLRVGYVSAHFRNHAVNFFVEPILASHDRSRFEVFCYSNVEFPDHVTAQLQTAVDHWRPIRNEPDDRVAQLIRDDAIDILIDLTGHIGENRLLVFALKPAPVQVTYIGYQNTTGMSAMDYRLTDERADPPGVTDRYYTERLVRLPRAFFCYQPGEAPAVSPSPANERGHVTFGSFNLFAKVNAQVIATWIEILARVPDSRLWVLANQGGYAEQKFAEQARARGVDPARVEIHARRPRAEYLRLVSGVDIALDPFPFNGHTTTCDAIWMGVPVVMLEGDAYASRFGGSVLANVGLGELIANSPDQYVDIAVALANDGDKLARLRAELRPRMAASPLMDFVGFTRNLEAAYRQMWADWCAIQAPGQ